MEEDHDSFEPTLAALLAVAALERVLADLLVDAAPYHLAEGVSPGPYD
jgi:hypothetical protein